MNVMFRGLEGVTAGNAEGSLMLIADCLQFGDDLWKVFGRFQENVDVDDRLGGESGNRDASDVFDRGCERAQDGGRCASEPLRIAGTTAGRTLR